MRFVSVYLVEGDDGWTMIDAGYDYPEGCEAWERAPKRSDSTSGGTWRG